MQVMLHTVAFAVNCYWSMVQRYLYGWGITVLFDMVMQYALVYFHSISFSLEQIGYGNWDGCPLSYFHSFANANWSKMQLKKKKEAAFVLPNKGSLLYIYFIAVRTFYKCCFIFSQELLCLILKFIPTGCVVENNVFLPKWSKSCLHFVSKWCHI